MPDGGDRQIRRGRKFDQVLDGARDIFLSDGFEGASVDDIAKAAGVSKATLYSYFPDKTLLFMGVAKAECCAQASRALDELPCQGSIEANLGGSVPGSGKGAASGQAAIARARRTSVEGPGSATWRSRWCARLGWAGARWCGSWRG